MFFDDNLGFGRIPAFSTVAALQTGLPADRGRCNSETCSHGAASLDGSNHVGYVSHQKRTIPLFTKQLRRLLRRDPVFRQTIRFSIAAGWAGAVADMMMQQAGRSNRDAGEGSECLLYLGG